MRYWDDIEIGETTRSSTMRVDEAAMVEFACKYDPQPFHTDRQAAKESLFDGLIASGIYTAALWRLMDHEVSGDIAFICGVAWDEVKWRRPVRPGDLIYATSRCVMKRRSAKRPGAGVITLHHEVLKQNDEVVLCFDSTDLVRRRPEA